MTGRDNSDCAGEFDIIRQYFAPLTEDFAGSLGLLDDAAVFAPAPDCDLVVTVDAIVADVHFLAGDPPGDVAAKLLRVNLSDLAAMGAEPLAYVLTTAWPRDIDEAWIAGFARGLHADQKRFGIHLAGGDTVATDGPMTLSLTAIGQVPKGQALTRGGAKAGDVVLVSGTIGDAGAGLLVATGQGGADLDPEDRDFLLRRYRRPEPRLDLGQALRGLASAVIDVSDGVLADLGHICEVSAVAAEIELPLLPMSAAAGLCLEPVAAVSAGDDYELLLTVPSSRRGLVAAAARESGASLSEIGRITEAGPVRVVLLDAAGSQVALPSGGYRHF
jgi:thiamine-monophosphate kinase